MRRATRIVFAANWEEGSAADASTSLFFQLGLVAAPPVLARNFCRCNLCDDVVFDVLGVFCRRLFGPRPQRLDVLHARDPDAGAALQHNYTITIFFVLEVARQFRDGILTSFSQE